MTNKTKYSTIRGKVANTKRLASSVNGNPRYLVTIVDDQGNEYQARTEPDSMLAYAITGRDYRDKSHTFYVNGRGNIGARAGS